MTFRQTIKPHASCHCSPLTFSTLPVYQIAHACMVAQLLQGSWAGSKMVAGMLRARRHMAALPSSCHSWHPRECFMMSGASPLHACCHGPNRAPNGCNKYQQCTGRSAAFPHCVCACVCASHGFVGCSAVMQQAALIAAMEYWPFNFFQT